VGGHSVPSPPHPPRQGIPDPGPLPQIRFYNLGPPVRCAPDPNCRRFERRSGQVPGLRVRQLLKQKGCVGTRCVTDPVSFNTGKLQCTPRPDAIEQRSERRAIGRRRATQYVRMLAHRRSRWAKSRARSVRCGGDDCFCVERAPGSRHQCGDGLSSFERITCGRSCAESPPPGYGTVSTGAKMLAS